MVWALARIGHRGRILRPEGQKREFGVGHSIVFAKWCPYAGERLKMALKVSDSDKLAYYRRNLKILGPSRGALEGSKTVKL